ncbi:MAG: DUF1570 domain-containing protein [Planctomycetes bacterium]|nr:DUF1570 domain-containing protein [Planctomycetota bacterium]
MTRKLTVAALGAAVLLALAPSADAGVHKDTRLGFQIKPPKDFESIALQPGQTNPVAQWQDPRKEYGSGNESSMYLNARFEIMAYSRAFADAFEGGYESFLDDKWEDCDSWLGYGEVEKEKKIRVDGSDAREKAVSFEEAGITMYFAMIPQDDYVFLVTGKSLLNRYKGRASDFSKAAKSFERIEKEDAGERSAELAQMDDQERRLQTVIDQLPEGWDHMRTDRYLFVYNADKDFVKDLGKQIEAIRDVYEKLYPPDRPITDVSIVRVCKDRTTYMGYGGPAGAGGHWSPWLKELVIFDMPPRDNTVAVLNHEAFHQYIYYYYGELSPHSWYNEGTGDYFAGAKMTKTYRIQGFGNGPGGFGRQETVKEAVRETRSGREGITPLKELMNYSQGEYYNNAGVHYAQGWALIHMLRESKRLKPAWARILDDYLVNLLAARTEVATEVMNKEREKAEKKKKGSSDEMSKDPKDWYGQADTDDIQKRAYEKTFASWSDADWDEFNEAYMDYVESL